MAEKTLLLLIRHGESMANLQGFFGGNYDAELTELGHRQAMRTGAFIAGSYAVDAVYASDLKRAARTGQWVAEAAKVPLFPEPKLREIAAGLWEGTPFTEIEKMEGPDWQIWRRDIGHARCPQGEAVAELAARVWEALDRIARENPGKTLAIATHATPIRTAMWQISGKPLGHMKDIPWVSNASVTEVYVENGTFSLGKISQDAHLEDMKTVLPPNV